MRTLATRLLALALLGTAGLADATVIVTISGRKATADISVSNGGPTYTATVELEFKNPQNLTEACLGISASALSAAQVAAINARLPNPANESVDSAFPVLIQVEPPAGCGLAFDEEVDIEVHTANLLYVAPSEYRLVKAPIGLAFHDVTSDVLPGSVRVRGSSGGFSEFVVIKLATQDNAFDADAAYDAAQSRLSDPAIATAARHQLELDLAVSRAAFGSADYATALTYLTKFDTDVATFSGDDCPGRWRSARDLDDAAGELIERSRAVRFYLTRLAGP